MAKQFKNILFASDLSTKMKQVFEYAATLSAYSEGNIIILHVMDDEDSSHIKYTKMAFGKEVWDTIKSEKRESAKKAMIGKNVTALKIREAIQNFFEDDNEKEQNSSSPVNNVIVTESRSIADEIIGTSREEDCDLIVMGCKHPSLLKKTIGINIVKDVLKRSKIPVLLVPCEKS